MTVAIWLLVVGVACWWGPIRRAVREMRRPDDQLGPSEKGFWGRR